MNSTKPELELSYIDRGEGTTVVLLHGFCESKELWTDYIQELSKKYRVIAIDLPGFGENPAIDMPLTIGDMAEAIYQLLSFLKIERSVMIGHSLGGYVALAYGEKFPQRLQGLGLFHSSCLSDTFEKKQARNKTIDFIERYGVEEFVEEFVTPLFFDGRKKELKDQIKFLTDLGKQVPASSVIETIKAMRDRKDRSRVLERASFPVLFIVGRNDSAISFSSSQQQFGLAANATIHIMSNTGHMGMLERPAETLKMVDDFILQAEQA